MDIFINDYINGEDSLCRDEHQFSLYLYQLLNGCKKVKLDLEDYANKNYEVYQAFYMGTFLRDYFNEAKDKAQFNYRLLTFANRKLRALYAGDEAEGVVLEDLDVHKQFDGEVYNIDSEVSKEHPEFDLAKHINGWSKTERIYRNPIARWMMNVRPDLALLLKRRGIKRSEFRLHFVDCKYLDGIDTYPAVVGRFDESAKKLQSCKRITCTKQQIERWVLEFLCDTPSEEYADTLGIQYFGQPKETESLVDNVGISIDCGFVSLANFVSAKNKNQYDEGDRVIEVKKLQEFNHAFFQEERKIKEPKVILGQTVEIQF